MIENQLCHGQISSEELFGRGTMKDSPITVTTIPTSPTASRRRLVNHLLQLFWRIRPLSVSPLRLWLRRLKPSAVRRVQRGLPLLNRSIGLRQLEGRRGRSENVICLVD